MPGRPQLPSGYLSANQLPDSSKLLPAPPAAGSAAKAADEDIHRQAAALRGTPRWDLAAQDANLGPDALRAFSCAVGLELSEKQTPATIKLLRGATSDTARSTDAAKNLYKRVRPFVEHDESTCYAPQEPMLRNNGSYPSGHTAFGWGAALVLTQVVPERAGQILARGRAFGESRLVCNAHWQSDVVQARFIAASTIARLQSVPQFQRDVAAASREIAAVRKRGADPAQNCEAEARALAQSIPGAQ
ncbi:MAG: phosphatase PAP2 family protein [Steroidobacteraceae bacterium]